MNQPRGKAEARRLGRSNVLILAALTLVLAAVAYLTMSLYWENQAHTLALFQEHQLQEATQSAAALELYLQSLAQDLRMLAMSASIRQLNRAGMAVEIPPMFRDLSPDCVEGISIMDPAGTVIFSADVETQNPSRIAAELTRWVAHQPGKDPVFVDVAAGQSGNRPSRSRLLITLAAPLHGPNTGAFPEERLREHRRLYDAGNRTRNRNRG